MTVYIRDAKLGDEKVLLDLIQQLSIYEKKHINNIKITKEKIIQHCFSDKPYFHAKIIALNNADVGYVIYYYTYATSIGQPRLYVEDLFILPGFRQRGLGKKLLINLAQLALQNKCCCMHWHVYTWNENAIKFYESLGVDKKSDLLLMRLERKVLDALARSDN